MSIGPSLAWDVTGAWRRHFFDFSAIPALTDSHSRFANAGNHEGGWIAALAILGIPPSSALVIALASHALVFVYVVIPAFNESIQIGDGQMRPGDLPALLDSVVRGIADYAKGNRLVTGEAYQKIPRIRYLGNAFLSLLGAFFGVLCNVVPVF